MNDIIEFFMGFCAVMLFVIWRVLVRIAYALEERK